MIQCFIGSQSARPCVIDAGVSEQLIDSYQKNTAVRQKLMKQDFKSLANSEVANDSVRR